MSSAYDKDLRKLALDICEKLDCSCFMQEGVYCMVGGPNFETVAEARYLHKMGADAVAPVSSELGTPGARWNLTHMVVAVGLTGQGYPLQSWRLGCKPGTLRLPAQILTKRARLVTHLTCCVPVHQTQPRGPSVLFTLRYSRRRLLIGCFFSRPVCFPGMSTVPEVLVAKHCGLKVFGLSLITNKVVKEYNDKEMVNHEGVLGVSKTRAGTLQALVTELVGQLDISINAADEGCHTSLATLDRSS
ncbi:Purine nucleoside phosphorylase [Acipenser ruthenus]|uniref:purine-nucleoside phosphorylase n=1 Tax=Acipenser ruthenus TaxID=7906 RepID=A0A444UY32_ACIRT|nr:Purine nucleoside phosphorylase [Acipenser ruthenus]